MSKRGTDLVPTVSGKSNYAAAGIVGSGNIGYVRKALAAPSLEPRMYWRRRDFTLQLPFRRLFRAQLQGHQRVSW